MHSRRQPEGVDMRHVGHDHAQHHGVAVHHPVAVGAEALAFMLDREIDVAAGIDLVVSVVDGGANHEGGAAVLAVEATDSEPESAGE